MVNVQSIPSPAIHAEDRAHEADHPTSQVAMFGADQPLKLDCGIDLTPFQIAYQTYGELNADRSNAILICHALTGDQHVANVHPRDRQARLVGNAWSVPAVRSTPTATSSSAPT